MVISLAREVLQMKLTKLAAVAGAVVALAAAAPVAAFARHGADDRIGHVRHGHGADDGPAHVRRGGDDGPRHR
jgi:hypothetical protein